MSNQILGGRYQIIRKLGGGGFGQTYLAQDLHLPGKPACVVKQLKPKVNNAIVLAAAQTLFDAEAEVLHALGHHDQIPRLTAHFQENQEFYLVQEYIEGTVLSQAWKGKLPLPESDVRAFLRDILTLLIFVHDHQVVHRDIKPGNLIRRTRDQKIVLIDFGAVKQMAFSHAEDPAMIVGSSGYAPPEQLAGSACFESDLYAVGMMAIQALTGSSPKHLQRDPHTQEVIWRDQAEVSPELADILDRMVHYDSQQRYPSAHAIVEQLQTLEEVISPEDGGKAWQERGDYLLQRHHYREAISAYDKALQVQGEDAQLWFKRALAADSFQYFEEALAGYDRVIQLEPNHCKAWLKRGMVLENLQRLEDALNCYTHVVQLQPDNYWAWHDRGKLLEALEQWDEALVAYNRAIQMKPTFQLAVESRKRLMMARGQIERLLQAGHCQEALEVVVQLRQQQPTNVHYRILHSMTLAKFKRYEEALTLLDGILASQPNQFRALVEKGILLSQLKRWEEALTCITQAIAHGGTENLDQKSSLAKAWHHRGWLLEKLNNSEEALLAYHQALELHPELTSALAGKTRTLEKLQNEGQTPWSDEMEDSTVMTGGTVVTTEAPSLISALAVAQSASPLANRHSGEPSSSFLMRGGLWEKVRNHSVLMMGNNQTLKVNPDDPEALKARGNVLVALGRYEEAIAVYDQAITRQPDNPSLWCCVASALVKLKRYREAISCFDRAIHIKPESHVPWYWRGRILMELKQYQEALHSLETALSNKPDFQPALRDRAQVYNLLAQASSTDGKHRSS
ncbi:serine/threonine-protein kinase [Alkalinema sp. FACHB-956]|uniref:serine/threonine-protein kinase n=1 Tax=Alkalinema sp. FACHB-956 TaxID=2692768 RepID=UPI001685CC92|nr:serine/threonine-protein kinase [Alkalinema sp. FACHB-956]MBD2326337.1 tetratricopeptide repeat protein [Alkalinema sp. FACHB-956]